MCKALDYRNLRVCGRLYTVYFWQDGPDWKPSIEIEFVETGGKAVKLTDDLRDRLTGMIMDAI